MANYMRHTLRDSFVSGSVAINANYANAVAHPMIAAPTLGLPPAFQGIVQGIHVHMTGLTGSPTSITLRLCLDSAGNLTVVPDTTATIATGIGTATEGCVAVAVQLPVFQVTGGATLYLFCKTDTGSATIANSCVTWTE